jgi:hypothetical protein
MAAVNIKTVLIEKVKSLSSTEAKRVYGMMLEYEVNDSLFKSFDKIPTEHILLLKKGMNDLKQGKRQKATDFIKELKKKYA